MNKLYEFGPYRLDPSCRKVWRGNEQVRLTGKQFDVLHAIIKDEAGVAETDRILEEVWPGDRSDMESKLAKLAKQVSDLRRKLSSEEDDPNYLANVSGQGYFISVPVKTYCLDDENRIDVEASRQNGPSEGAAPKPRSKLLVGLVFMAALAVICIVVWLSFQSNSSRTKTNGSSLVRMLSLSTTEGGSPLSRQIPFAPGTLLVTPNGKRVYIIEAMGKRVLVLNSADLKLEDSLTMPSNAGRAVMSPDGRQIYLGSLVDGIIVIHTSENRAEDTGIRTGGPVWDLDVTADGSKAYLAMGSGGLKEVDLKSRKVRSLSRDPSPQFLKIDRTGHQLFVSYQAGGPGGRPGHDALVVYDLKESDRTRLAPRLPRVGGPVWMVPALNRVLLDEWNACSAAIYDHEGCPSPEPARVLHILSTTDLSLIKTLALPVSTTGECAFSPDGKQCLFPGTSLVFYDIARQKVLESYSSTDREFRLASFAPDGQRVFAYCVNKATASQEILMFQAGNPKDLVPELGLTNLYSGDGASDDVKGAGSAKPFGAVGFSPGKIGQAFHFSADKQGFLEIDPVDSCLECGDEWTIRLYFKLGAKGGEETVLLRERSDRRPGYRLFKSSNSRLVLEVDQDHGRSVASGEVEEGKWYRVDLISTGGSIDMFLNGVVWGKIRLPIPDPAKGRWGEVFLGGSPNGAQFDGWIDEVAFYDRALTPNEIGR